MLHFNGNHFADSSNTAHPSPHSADIYIFFPFKEHLGDSSNIRKCVLTVTAGDALSQIPESIVPAQPDQSNREQQPSPSALHVCQRRIWGQNKTWVCCWAGSARCWHSAGNAWERIAAALQAESSNLRRGFILTAGWEQRGCVTWLASGGNFT